MNANEIRRRNLFHRILRRTEIHLPDTSTVFEVVTMPFENVQAVRLGENPAQIEKWDEIRYSDLSPIPITEDWLLRFGFECLHESKYRKSYDLEIVGNLIMYTIHKGDESLTGVCWRGENIGKEQSMYVHQLQNLTFALTGQELTIKLEQ